MRPWVCALLLCACHAADGMPDDPLFPADGGQDACREPTRLARTDTFGMVTGFAQNTTHLFWVEVDDDWDPDRVSLWRVPKGGGAPEEVFEGLDVKDLFADDEWVWFRAGDDLARLPAGGGTAETRHDLTGVTIFHDEVQSYLTAWTLAGGGRLEELDRETGARRTLATFALEHTVVAADDGAVFLTAAGGGIVAIDRATGAATTLVGDDGGLVVARGVVDAGALHVLEVGTGLVRVPRDGSARVTVAPATDGRHVVGGDDLVVFYDADEDVAVAVTPDRAPATRPLDTRVAGLLADDERVYWITGSLLSRTIATLPKRCFTER